MPTYVEQQKAGLASFITALTKAREDHELLIPDVLIGNLEFVIDEAQAEFEAIRERG